MSGAPAPSGSPGGVRVEAGRRYRRADGLVTGPLCRSSWATVYPWVDRDGLTYTDTGRFNIVTEDSRDLVAAIPTNAEKLHDAMTLDDWRRAIDTMGFLR